MTDVAEPTNRIRNLWLRTRSIPGGTRLFSLLLGRIVPYTGSISPRVEELRDGYARVSMRDRRRLRNHLSSLHAMSIMNLAEAASGLALNYGLPDDARAILTNLSIDYVKKARGTLTAEASFPTPSAAERAEHELPTVIRDATGDVVARAVARWLVGPREETTSPSHSGLND